MEDMMPFYSEDVAMEEMRDDLFMAKLGERTNQRARMLPIKSVYIHGGITDRVRNEKIIQMIIAVRLWAVS
jgi:hypothetical protein